VSVDLRGRVAIVTGGSGGIGRATVVALAAAGARVYALDLQPPRSPLPADCEHLEVDVSDSRAVTSAVDRVAEQAGGLDHVIHCAGLTRDRALWKLTDEDWAQVLGVNLSGAFYLLRAATPHLRARGGGALVLVASINGERGKRGQANYSASKGGLIALGKTAARELAYFGVRVNMVSPGLITGTPMTDAMPAEALAKAHAETPLPREGRPEDVAHAISFLCSDHSAHVTGQVLRVDGGQLI
jgi:3-oxoacyl-[acyl-carrier protein] reductase